MKKYLIASLLLIGFIAHPLAASSAEPMEKELLNAFNKQLVAMHTGDFEAVMTSYTTQAQREYFSGLLLAKEGREYIMKEGKPPAGEANTVKKFENVELSSDGKKARAFAYVKTKLLSENDGKVVESPKTELTEIVFQSERNAWKISRRDTFGFEEDLKRTKAKSFNAKEAAVDEEQVNGLVVKVDYNAKETVARVRVKERMFTYREVLVFLPMRKELEKQGISILPWKSYTFTGRKHKSDDLRFLASKAEPAKEESL